MYCVYICSPLIREKMFAYILIIRLGKVKIKEGWSFCFMFICGIFVWATPFINLKENIEGEIGCLICYLCHCYLTFTIRFKNIYSILMLERDRGFIKSLPTMFFQKSKKDALNFDAEFTKEEPVLTPINADVVRSINQEEFRGFSFVNPDFNPGRYHYPSGSADKN